MRYNLIFFIFYFSFFLFLKDSYAETQKIFKKVYLKKTNDLIEFKVEIAQTFEERAQGLMHRKRLVNIQGMLFINPRNIHTTFWMKNTYIALDIIFIHKNKKISQIYENVRPLDLKPIRSDQPVCYILEVPAGYVKFHNIQVHDQLSWN